MRGLFKGCMLLGALYMGVVGYYLYLTVGALGGHAKHSGSAVHGVSAGLTLLQSAPYTGLILLAVVLLWRRGRRRRMAERDAVLGADSRR